MPLFKQNHAAPMWSALQYFEILDIPQEGSCAFGKTSLKEKIIIIKGGCLVEVSGMPVRATINDVFNLKNSNDHLVIRADEEAVTLVRMCGDWHYDDNFCGLFNPSDHLQFQEVGDPIRYPKNSEMDNHYHDYDAFWIICSGHGLVVTEGAIIEVEAGDCVATGMGHHHDFPICSQPVQAVFLAGDPEGGKRKGHLWEHVHGKAVPKRGRI